MGARGGWGERGELSPLRRQHFKQQGFLPEGGGEACKYIFGIKNPLEKRQQQIFLSFNQVIAEVMS